jgi:hypothetical protein
MYNWIAAGAEVQAACGVDCYVKFKKRSGAYEEHQYLDGLLVKLQDKEIFITKSGYRDYNHGSQLHDYDYCTNLDMLGLGNSGVNHSGLMFCYTNKKSARHHRYDKSKFNTYLFGDSGGFKLATGTESFIDPVDLAHWYNLYVRQGMTLDVPPWCTDMETLLRHAAIQKLNTKIIKDNLDGSVELYNISHGYDFESRLRYLDAVQDDDLTNWGIGSAYFGNPYDFITNVMTSLQNVKQVDKAHIFGIANTLLIPVLAWIGKYYTITSDSSTHVQSAKSMILFQMQGHQLKKIRVGKTDPAILLSPNQNPLLTCTCPACTCLNDFEFYSNAVGTAYPFLLLCMHNINILAQYGRIWNDLAQTCNLTQYTKMFSNLLPSKNFKIWKNVFNYIEDIQEYGVPKASKRYSSYLMSTFGKSLLSKKGNPAYYCLFDEEEVVEEVSETEEISALERYEQFHKYNKVPDTFTEAQLQKVFVSQIFKTLECEQDKTKLNNVNNEDFYYMVSEIHSLFKEDFKVDMVHFDKYLKQSIINYKKSIKLQKKKAKQLELSKIGGIGIKGFTKSSKIKKVKKK